MKNGDERWGEMRKVGESAVLRAIADPAVMEIVSSPNIDDETKCKAIFGGKEFACRGGCGKMIHWPGACDECIERVERKAEPRTKREAVEKTGVPPQMAGETWESWIEPKRLAVATDGVTIHEVMARVNRLKGWRGVPSLVVISGPAGTGKTHMAIATLRRRVEEKGHYGTMFVHNDKLVEALLDSGNDLVDRAFRSRFLIVDDFGRGMKADFKREMLCSMACRRYDEGKVTLLTTNLSGSDIEAMDERLHSRMYQGLFVTTRGLKDWRKA